ncbi:indoleamine 2,3-dioxygenase 2 [Rhinophrynus dorsalis]
MESQERTSIHPKDFYVSEEFGFILQDPLKKLPEYYKPWMTIAQNLCPLIETRQLRDEVKQMPELSIQHLAGHRAQRLARLILSHIVMGYVWQDGDQGAVKVLPRTLAVPYHQLSQVLGMPPILVHADLVLANWRQKDPEGSHSVPLPGRNMTTIVSLPGGDSLQGFVLVTLLVELAAVPGVKAVSQVVSALLCEDEQTLLQALGDLVQSINKMNEALKLMNDYVDADVFYNTIRVFLSGWRDNPSMPEGLIYEGVTEEPLMLSGGSAAQSSVFHVFDELLGIQHRPQSADFLLRMRQYMPPAHRCFVEWVGKAPSLPRYILQSRNPELLAAFNQCVTALADLRSFHIRIVSKYVCSAGARARIERQEGRNPQERGTGGSQVMSFLKSVRGTSLEGLLK